MENGKSEECCLCEFVSRSLQELEKHIEDRHNEIFQIEEAQLQNFTNHYEEQQPTTASPLITKTQKFPALNEANQKANKDEVINQVKFVCESDKPKFGFYQFSALNINKELYSEPNLHLNTKNHSGSAAANDVTHSQKVISKNEQTSQILKKYKTGNKTDSKRSNATEENSSQNYDRISIKRTSATSNLGLEFNKIRFSDSNSNVSPFPNLRNKYSKKLRSNKNNNTGLHRVIKTEPPAFSTTAKFEDVIDLKKKMPEDLKMKEEKKDEPYYTNVKHSQGSFSFVFPSEANRMSLQEIFLINYSFVNSPDKWTCTHCKLRFTGEAFVNHQLQLSLSSKGQFVCTMCKLEFPNEGSMLKHNVNVHESMVYACSFCPKTFAQKVVMNRHKKAAHYERLDHACSICSEKFVEQQGLFKHQTSVHGGKSAQLKCNECNKDLSSKRNLMHHIFSFHGKDLSKKHVCPICDKKFLLFNYLRIHLKRMHVMKKESSQSEKACLV